MNQYEERYASILQDIARGRGELTGLSTGPQLFPRVEHSAKVVRRKKGGLLSKGGLDDGDNLALDLTLADGWENGRNFDLAFSRSRCACRSGVGFRADLPLRCLTCQNRATDRSALWSQSPKPPTTRSSR